MTATSLRVAAPPAVRRPGAVLAVVSLASFMASLDLFIVNVALPDIAVSYHGSTLSDLSWVLNGYAVIYAALLVPLGRLSDRYGRLNGFLAGLALFTAASAACAASSSLWMLVAFRGLQAVGAAALTPTSLGLLLAATPDAGKVRAVRIWAAIGALAAAFGPVVGGLLVEANWRWVFLVNLPVGIGALIAARRVVPDSRDPAVTRMPDVLGSVIAAIAVGSVALGLVKAPAWGWTSLRVVGCLLLGVVATVVFWRRSEHHPLPVVEPALLRVRAFAWSTVTAVMFSVAFGAGLLAAVLWLQDVWGFSALRTGLAIAPGPLMVPVFAAVSQRLAPRVSAARLAALGCALFGLGSLITLSLADVHTSYATTFLPGWLIGGIGVGFALPTIISSATADLPPARAATGSAVVTMGRQLGLVLGVSVLIAVLATPVGPAQTHEAYVRGWLVIVIASAVAAVTAFGMTPRGVDATAAAFADG